MKANVMYRLQIINGSPNENGNTAHLASILLNGKEYETLNLTNFTIGSYGQTLPYDGLDRVIEKMKEADTIVIGQCKVVFDISHREFLLDYILLGWFYSAGFQIANVRIFYA